MTSKEAHKRVTVRAFYGGGFEFKNGKFEYVGGAANLKHGVLLDNLTVEFFKKHARSLTKREDYEIWYRRPMRSINDAHGRGLLVSSFDLINILKTVCKTTHTVSVWITLPKTASNASSSILQGTESVSMSVNMGIGEKDSEGIKNFSGKKQLVGAHNNFNDSSLQFKAPRQKLPTQNPLSPRRSPRHNKPTTQNISTQSPENQISTSDLQICTSNPIRDKLPCKSNLLPGIVIREIEDCVNEEGSGSVAVLTEKGKGKEKVKEKAKVKKGDTKGKGKVSESRKEEVVGVKKAVKGKKKSKVFKGKKKINESEFNDSEFTDSEDSEAALSDCDFGLNEFDLGLNVVDYFINNQQKEGDPLLKSVEAAVVVEGQKSNKVAGECSKANNKVLVGVDDLDVEVNSDVDCDSDELRSLQGSDDEACPYPTFNADLDFGKAIKLSKGLKFPSVEIFRKALIHHSVKNGYDFWYSHNGRDRVTAQCYNRCNCEWNTNKSKLGKCVCGVENPCKFYVHARKLRDQETFQIKGLRLKHNCVMSNYNRKVGSEFLAHKYLEFFRTNLDWKIKRFQNHVLKDLGVNVPYMRCWLARCRAKLIIHGNGNDQYARVWDYAEALIKYNPGSSAFVVCDNIERPPLIFKRFYTCLKACKEGFKTGCRPILGIDGCHLKGVYPGMCLVAVGVDGNNNIYPVAWAVVEVENRDSWTWFLELLSQDIEKIDGEGLTVMSDRQKGLVDALANVVPKANIRFCARHIWANFKLRWSGQLFKDTFWAAARATTRADFKREMKGMEFLSKEAYAYLNDIPPQHWSRHAFDVDCKSNLLLNNVCEVFNAVLKEARDKPILTHLEWMRRYVMQRICQKKKGGMKVDGRLMPYVTKYLDWAKDESRFATFMQSNDAEYEVELKGEQYVVNLNTRSCGCKHWDLTGLPCPHAMACMLEKRMDPRNYVHDAYSKEKYMLTYAHSVSPMPGVKQWEPTGLPEPLPPPMRTMPGRPKSKKRRKSAGEVEEQQVKRLKRTNNCSNCGGLGHYKRTCKNPPAPPKTVAAPGGRPLGRSEWAKKKREVNQTRAARKETWRRAHQTANSPSTSTAANEPNQAPSTSMSFTELLSQASNNLL